MEVSSVGTFLVFLIGFGTLGAARGRHREMWTLGGITLTMLFLALGGVEIIKQLPVRIASGFLAMSGNQDGSNSAAAHPLQEPWTIIMLWVGVAALVALAYVMGQKFAAKDDPRDFGSYVGGFLMGAINGACICIFLFSQGGFQNVTIHFPDGMMARGAIPPLILIGVFVLGAAFLAFRPTKPAGGSGK